MEVTYLQDQNSGTGDHSKQKAVLNMTDNFLTTDKKMKLMVASNHKQHKNRLQTAQSIKTFSRLHVIIFAVSTNVKRNFFNEDGCLLGCSAV
jgi:hypothetical protein